MRFEGTRSRSVVSEKQKESALCQKAFAQHAKKSDSEETYLELAVIY